MAAAPSERSCSTSDRNSERGAPSGLRAGPPAVAAAGGDAEHPWAGAIAGAERRWREETLVVVVHLALEGLDEGFPRRVRPGATQALEETQGEAVAQEHEVVVLGAGVGHVLAGEGDEAAPGRRLQQDSG